MNDVTKLHRIVQRHDIKAKIKKVKEILGEEGKAAISDLHRAAHKPHIKATVKKLKGILGLEETDPYLQALDIVHRKNHFSSKDFIDINATNAQGYTVLHYATSLNNKNMITQLLQAGADPTVENSSGHTPLSMARTFQYSEALQTLLHHALSTHPDLLKFSDFTLFKAKGDGVNVGGFYRDQNNKGWLIKEGHEDNPLSIVKEYIAGGLFQLFLGHNAPRTEMVINDSDATLLTGSKLLHDFKTIAQHQVELVQHQTEMIRQGNYEYESSYGKDFPTTFNGKPISGFFDVISAVHFLADTDAKYDNVGMIDHVDFYSFAKIDHGYAFGFCDSPNSITLDSFRNHLNEHYGFTNLEKVGFEEVYQGITHVANMDFSVIEDTLTSKMKLVHDNMEVLGLKSLFNFYGAQQVGDLNFDLKTYQDDLIFNLKERHEHFQQMAKTMMLEKTIRDHDVIGLSDVLDQGISLNEPFKPFYNPTYALQQDFTPGTLSVTGIQLITQHWPDLLKPSDKTTLPLTEKDVFDTAPSHDDKDISHLLGNVAKPHAQVETAFDTFHSAQPPMQDVLVHMEQPQPMHGFA
ncbi:MAG: ankyrin repeat domain-containing protein [Candidatus Berkiellales bacterium]